MLPLILEIAAVVIVAIVLFQSFHNIGPAQVGLVTKKIARKSLAEGNPVARHGEAGYQERLLMPGLRVRLWPVYGVSKQPWVQVPAGEIGVVIAQVGNPIKIGAKSADFRPAFGNFSNLGAFIDNGGQKGVQRPVLPPGTLVPIHPAAFLVITASRVYGVPVSRSVAGTPVPAGQNLAAVVVRPLRRAAARHGHRPGRRDRHGGRHHHARGRTAAAPVTSPADSAASRTWW